jgi:murein tripeptide amidase MpaA
VELALRSDSAAAIQQWFSFTVASNAKARRVAIVNAGDSSFPNGWPGYEVMASADGKSWSRVATEFDQGALSFLHNARSELTHYAYFAPYSAARLARQLARINRASHVDVRELGRSYADAPLYEVELGDSDAQRTVWLIARQHPGETPASWAIEGLLKRLAKAADEPTRELLERAVIRVVPIVNPDGAELGNHRTSASGADLNRVWDDPSEETPEVSAILRRLEETGCDLFFDLHADESSSAAFAAKSEGNPSFTSEIETAEAELSSSLAAYCHEFIDEPYYELDAPEEADLSCAANQIGERFGCPSITLELPMKGDGTERVRRGWNERRAHKFGAAMVDALAEVVLRNL